MYKLPYIIDYFIIYYDYYFNKKPFKNSCILVTTEKISQNILFYQKNDEGAIINLSLTYIYN